jgi:mono/diheme cytochrome c family protein
LDSTGRPVESKRILSGSEGSLTLSVSAAGQESRNQKRVWDGVFNSEQAARGQAEYNLSCARCHNIALIGSERGPAIKGDAFLSKWEKDNLAGLFIKIRDTMPQSGPGTVRDEAKIDILAFILQENGFPAGAEPLKADLSSLGDIRLGRRGIWDGVFTAAQAERGQAALQQGRCNGCHGPDLSGDRGPALRGEHFAATWGNGSVNQLFAKIRDTMPLNNAEQVSAAAKIDIVAYLLQLNGYPAGPSELTLDEDFLESIQVVGKDAEAAGPPNFTLVQVVGCLAPGANGRWMLTNATEPAPTRDETPMPGALERAAAESLGTQTFELVSVPRSLEREPWGKKAAARGLLYRAPSDAALNLTSLEIVASNCAR